MLKYPKSMIVVEVLIFLEYYAEGRKRKRGRNFVEIWKKKFRVFLIFGSLNYHNWGIIPWLLDIFSSSLELYIYEMDWGQRSFAKPAKINHNIAKDFRPICLS